MFILGLSEMSLSKPVLLILLRFHLYLSKMSTLPAVDIITAWNINVSINTDDYISSFFPLYKQLSPTLLDQSGLTWRHLRRTTLQQRYMQTLPSSIIFETPRFHICKILKRKKGHFCFKLLGASNVGYYSCKWLLKFLTLRVWNLKLA